MSVVMVVETTAVVVVVEIVVVGVVATIIDGLVVVVVKVELALFLFTGDLPFFLSSSTNTFGFRGLVVMGSS